MVFIADVIDWMNGTMFDTIIGQERPKKLLSAMISNDRLPHAMLFAGPFGVGKTEMAFALAQRLLCSDGILSECFSCNACRRVSKLEHPDLHVLFPFRGAAGKTGDTARIEEYTSHIQTLAGEPYYPHVYPKSMQIVVDFVEEVKDRLLISSLEGGRKVCVILNVEHMNPTTSNMILKILEEPPQGVYFILTTEQVSDVLPTIVSRASVIRFRRLKVDEIAGYLTQTAGLAAGDAEKYAAMAEGSIKKAKLLAQDKRLRIREYAYDMYRTAAQSTEAHIPSLVLPFMQLRDQQEAEEIIDGFSRTTEAVFHAACSEPAHGQADDAGIVTLAGRTDLGRLSVLARELERGCDLLKGNNNISTVMTTLLYGIHDAYR